VTPGVGISAYRVCQIPPLIEALGTQPCGSLRRRRCGYRRRTLWVYACPRLEKMVLSYTGEVPRRPNVR
jgi:hypothetical protein